MLVRSRCRQTGRGFAPSGPVIPTFKFTINTELTGAGNKNFSFWANGPGNFDVDWGDGNSDLNQNIPGSGVSGYPHVYAAAGIYQITITWLSGFVSPDFYLQSDLTNIISIDAGVAGFGYGSSLEFAFRGGVNIASVGNWDMTGVVNVGATFFGCTGLLSIGKVIAPDANVFGIASQCVALTSQDAVTLGAVTNVNSAYLNSAALSETPELDYSTVTQAVSTFNGTGNITINIKNNDMSSCTDFSNFARNSDLTIFPSLDMSAVGADFREFLRDATSLTTLGTLTLSTDGTIEMILALFGCTSLTDLGNTVWPTAQNYSNTFASMSSLTTISAGRFAGNLTTNFTNGFGACALTAASIANVLADLNATDTSNGTLSFAGGTSAGRSSWSAQAESDATAMEGRGWTILSNA